MAVSQQQQLLVAGQQLQSTSSIPQPVYVNLGATTTCTSSNVQNVHKLLQQGNVNTKKPVVLNLGNINNIRQGVNANQPSNINLPIGTRLVVPSAAGLNQQISISTGLYIFRETYAFKLIMKVIYVVKVDKDMILLRQFKNTDFYYLFRFFKPNKEKNICLLHLYFIHQTYNRLKFFKFF